MKKYQTALVFTLILSLIISLCSGIFIYQNYSDFLLGKADNPNRDQLIKDIFSRNRRINSAPGKNGEEDAALSSLLPYFRDPGDIDSNYFEYKSQIKYGLAKDKCAIYKPFNEDESILESYSYSDSSNYYSKEIAKDKNGELITYQLSIPGKDYRYFGGQYTVESHYIVKDYEFREQTASEAKPATDLDMAVQSDPLIAPFPEPIDEMPIEDDLTPEEYIRMIFPEEVGYDIEKDPNSDGYIVTITSLINCNFGVEIMDSQSVGMRVVGSEQEANQRDHIVTRLWVEADSLRIYRTDTYFDQMHEDNLISSVTDESTSKRVDFNSVSKYFTYDLTVEVRVIEQIDYDEEYQRLSREFIKNNYNTILLPVSQDWEISSVNVPENFAIDTSPYLIDRAFYRSDDIGARMYQFELDARTDLENANKTSFKRLSTVFYVNYMDSGVGQRAEDLSNYDSGSTAASQRADDNSNTLSNYSVHLFKGLPTDDDILNNEKIVNSGDDLSPLSEVVTNIGDVNLAIDGATVIARVYEMKQLFGGGVSSPGSSGIEEDMILPEPAPDVINEDYKNYYFLFEYGGSKFGLNFWSSAIPGELVDNFVLKSASTNDNSALDLLFNY